MAENECDDVAHWPSNIETHFIHLIHEEAKKGMQTSKFTTKTWQAIDNAIFSKFGKRFTVPKLKTKFCRLRKMHREFTILLKQTGIGWDNVTNTITAGEEAWSTYVKKHPYGKRFKKKGCDHYETLGEIFSNTTMAGQMQYTSTMSPLHSDEERALEREFLNSGALVEVVQSNEETHMDENFGETPTCTSTRRRAVHYAVDERTRKNLKVINRQKDLDNAIGLLAKYITEKSAARTANRLQEESIARSPVKYTIEECMAKLVSIPDVPNAVFAKTAREFLSYDSRAIFMNIPEDRLHSFIGLD